jgi:hypothetical protein
VGDDVTSEQVLVPFEGGSSGIADLTWGQWDSDSSIPALTPQFSPPLNGGVTHAEDAH